MPLAMDPGGQRGSHGLLAKKLIMALAEDRDPAANVYEALAMTATGIVADRSALKGGEVLQIRTCDNE